MSEGVTDDVNASKRGRLTPRKMTRIEQDEKRAAMSMSEPAACVAMSARPAAAAKESKTPFELEWRGSDT
jgi:hypothetical protein